MIATLESSTATGWRDRYYACFPERYIKKTSETIKGRRFFHFTVSLPEKNNALSEKRMRRAAILLRDEGVDAVIVREGFPYVKLLRQFGISIVSPRHAYLACAPEIVKAVIRQKEIPFENTTGVIYADTIAKEAQELTFALIKMTEYIRLDCETGKERLLEKLSFEYGVCPLEKTVSAREILICFSLPDECYFQSSKAEIIINLNGGKIKKEDAIVFEGAEFALPPENPHEEYVKADAQAAVLLLMTGTLKAQDIKVLHVA